MASNHDEPLPTTAELTAALTTLPPSPVFWFSNTLDTVCEYAPCYNWRMAFPESFREEGAWFDEEFRVPPLSAIFPRLLTYRDYLKQNDIPSSGQAIWDYAFRTSSTELGDLTTPTAAVTLVVVTYLMRRLKKFTIPMFSSIGRNAARTSHGPEWVVTNEARIVKFGEYVFRLLFHSAVTIFGIVYFWDKSWWEPGGTYNCFDYYPYHAIEPGMTWYYLIQSAYNLEAMFSLLDLSFVVSFQSIKSSKGALQSPITIGWSPTVRGDFQEMLIHHIVTNLLVIGSSYFRFTRIGSMVFLVHDISDVPVDMSKLANFLKWKITTIVCFINMVIVWLITRLGVLPFRIFRSCWNEACLVSRYGAMKPYVYHCYRHFFNSLIIALIVLHLAWFVMFVRIGYVLISKGEAHDLSEHKKGEKETTGNKKDKKDE
eukprot:CAMPEP_0119548876 /NCGR_PEP_ID=MMETSP1352-20130426/2702_1 /TAXON_ID=265584 /ORGANISM="Stauroneis constricta, Strain CCMP1120" /LENGTH=427 /DNA_ID=CAMNT_0007594275 /DNA_START=105 /DNA_END=1388 /DNA_ORIENTATION=+